MAMRFAMEPFCAILNQHRIHGGVMFTIQKGQYMLSSFLNATKAIDSAVTRLLSDNTSVAAAYRVIPNPRPAQEVVAEANLIRRDIAAFLISSAGERFKPFIDTFVSTNQRIMETYCTPLDFVLVDDPDQTKRSIVPYAESARNTIQAVGERTYPQEDRGFLALSAFAYLGGAYGCYAIPFRPGIDGPGLLDVSDTQRYRARQLRNAVWAQSESDPAGAEVLDAVLRVHAAPRVDLDQVARIQSIAEQANLATQTIWIQASHKRSSVSLQDLKGA
jgi:hypothetical protein